MKYCKKCVQVDTRPGIYFNKDGVCGACLYAEEVKSIKWNERQKELQEIADTAKKLAKKNKSAYDCVIGVSGGKDSTYQAIIARDELGLRPLLVNGEPEGISKIGILNIENLKQLGFDVISLRPNPKVLKKMVRKDFYEHLNFGKATEASLWASTYIIADKFNIPLIIQGENAGLTLGVSKLGVGKDGNALNVFTLDTLKSGYQRYIGCEGITEKDLFLYHFNLDNIKNKGIKAIWLQYYKKEWTLNHNAKFSINKGLIIKPVDTDPYEMGTFCKFSQLDSDLVGLNQMFKYYKFGFGQCTDHAMYDIIEGIKTREEAIELVKKYDGKVGDRYIKQFCDWIDINMGEFWKVVDKFVNEKLFIKEKIGRYIPKFTVGVDFNEV